MNNKMTHTNLSTLMKIPEHAYIHALIKIKGRWQEAEPYIMQDPYWAYHYARDVIKGRWKEAEPYIMRDPGLAYNYALNIIKGRWREAEPFIVQSLWDSYLYSKRVIRGRWPLMENKIIDIRTTRHEMNIIETYCSYFLSNRNKLLPLWIKYYSKTFEVIGYFK